MPLALILVYSAFLGALGLKALKPMPHPPIPYSQAYYDMMRDR
jgi:hypothetical protein